MKRIIPLLVLCASLNAHSNSHIGELFQENCLSCHIVEGKPTIAPPVFAFKNHVLKAYPERADFIEFVTQWIQEPDEAKTTMKGAIKKFGLMPAQTMVDEPTAKALAAFVFDTDFDQPDWYAEHYKQEHGELPSN